MSRAQRDRRVGLNAMRTSGIALVETYFKLFAQPLGPGLMVVPGPHGSTNNSTSYQLVAV
jgi:hypothetical protein